MYSEVARFCHNMRLFYDDIADEFDAWVSVSSIDMCSAWPAVNNSGYAPSWGMDRICEDLTRNRGTRTRAMTP